MMPAMRWAIVVSTLLAAAPVAAQPGERDAGEGREAALLDDAARSLFEAGRAAYEEGRYEDALVSFRRAHEVSGRPALLFNVAQSLDRLRRDREAIEVFERYLATEPPPERRRVIEARLEILRANVAPTPAEVAEAEPEPGPPDALAADAEPTPTSGDDGGGGSRVAIVVGVIAGVVLVGTAVGLGVALSGGGDPSYQAGTTGVVHMALGSGR